MAKNVSEARASARAGSGDALPDGRASDTIGRRAGIKSIDHKNVNVGSRRRPYRNSKRRPAGLAPSASALPITMVSSPTRVDHKIARANLAIPPIRQVGGKTRPDVSLALHSKQRPSQLGWRPRRAHAWRSRSSHFACKRHRTRPAESTNRPS